MDLCSRKTIQQLLRQHDILPRKHWGQNFLISKHVLHRIIDAAGVNHNDTVLEIGGGIGTLTVELSRRAKRVIVYERDPKLCALLQNTLAHDTNIELRCADARNITSNQLPVTSYKLVANLPYSIGTVILRRLLESERPPQQSIIMLQREVAKRMIAKPPHMNLLAIAMQSLVEPRILFHVPKESFWPAPEVASSVLRLDVRSRRERRDVHPLLAAARRAFAHPRKFVLNNLSSSPSKREHLSFRCHIPPKARAQQLRLDQFRCIAKTENDAR